MKKCYCHTCQKPLHHMGVAGHRKMHFRRKEEFVITMSNGKTYRYSASKNSDENKTSNVR